MHFDVVDQLLISFLYLSDTGAKLGAQQGSALAISRLQESP